MSLRNNQWEELVAQSTLLPTAREFYPIRQDHPRDRPKRSQPRQGSSGSHPNDERDSIGHDPNIAGSSNSSQDVLSRNWEPKQSKNNFSRFKKVEKEMMKPLPSDGRLWRDGNREGRNGDSWQTNDNQAHSTAYRNRIDERKGASSASSDAGNRRSFPKNPNYKGNNNMHGIEKTPDDIADKPVNRKSNSYKARQPNGRIYSNSNNEENTGNFNENEQFSRRSSYQRQPSQLPDTRNDYRSDRHEGRNVEEQQWKANNRSRNNHDYDHGRSRFYNNSNESQKLEEEVRPERRERQVKSGHEMKRDRSEKGRNQMEVLISQLTRGTLECLVCCETVRQNQSTWSCRVCHHVLHLQCVTKWARASKADNGWHCPACRHVSTNTPTQYRCFCGKTTDPAWNRSDCPHTCGMVCGLDRPGPCSHRCTLPCHPGPCPTCHLYVTRECGCGAVSRKVPCSDTDPVVCGAICGRLLNCRHHECQSVCHGGECSKCDQLIQQACYCGSSVKEVPCTQDSVGVSTFSCGAVCSRKLLCGNHSCERNCHDGACPPCALLPSTTEYCPCGKSKLSQLSSAPRVSCLDAIPTCEEVCAQLLPCGQPGARHECGIKCHEGSCPPCPRDTTVRCRCGHMNKTISCSDLLVRPDDARCDKKCNKNRTCGKHKCREPCCIDVDHVCPLPCNRMLSCGSHRCEAQCHTGYCRPCTRDSFQELPCECGGEIIFPPVPCGTRRPKCLKPCSRRHDCDHPPMHSCHDEPLCPPCTFLVSKLCYGGHELRKAVFCHLEGLSCGIACGKPLPCGRHTCTLACHDGECLQPGQICTQPCTQVRAGCGHACGAACHDAPCPTDTPCKEMVRVTCECGLRFASRSCIDNSRDYQRIATAQLASKMADLAAGGTVDLSAVTGSNKKVSLKTLECTEECKLIERNRRLAVGLQIVNPDLSAKLTPRYSDFLRLWAKKDPYLCQTVHDKLTNLVQLAKQSKQKSRSYSFDSMNREKRQFIHEYCEHFGCESVAYDQEPNRNVVATAIRDKSWLPSLSILEVLQRENGARKVPLPSNSKTRFTPSLRSMEVLPTRGSVWGQQGFGPSTASTTGSTSRPAPPLHPTFAAAGAATAAPAPVVDYFDWTPSS